MKYEACTDEITKKTQWNMVRDIKIRIQYRTAKLSHVFRQHDLHTVHDHVMYCTAPSLHHCFKVIDRLCIYNLNMKFEGFYLFYNDLIALTIIVL